MNHKAGIWIDHKKAVAVSASASGVTVKTLESEVGPSLHESVEMKDGVTERRADADRRWNEERYRTLFEMGPVAVYSCDASGVIQEFNRRAVAGAASQC